MDLRYIFLFFYLANACADTSVWKVSKNDQHLFIGGTIHVLSSKDYPLPVAYNRAYQQSDRLIFETDINKVTGPAFQRSLASYFAYKDGKTLQSDLRPSTYLALQQYCQATNISLPLLAQFKPQYAALMLTSIELQKLGVNTAGVDQHFNQRAQQDGKPIDQLETIAEQINFIANMGSGQEDELILSTIRENQQLTEILQFMLNAWRNGDTTALDRDIVQPMRQEFPSIYRDILLTRNNNWIPHIVTYLQSQEVEFILVGALHLAGEDGLIAQLQDRGYSIIQW